MSVHIRQLFSIKILSPTLDRYCIPFHAANNWTMESRYNSIHKYQNHLLKVSCIETRQPDISNTIAIAMRLGITLCSISTRQQTAKTIIFASLSLSFSPCVCIPRR